MRWFIWAILGVVACTKGEGNDLDGDGVPDDEDCAPESADEGAPVVRYVDGDGDAFGAGGAVLACAADAPAGAVTTDGDCDDADAQTFPGAAREESLTACMHDGDGDGWGDATVPAEVGAGTDCDDAAPGTHPGAAEVCDGTDQDCDGDIDEGVLTTWYADRDGDTYGDPGASTEACAAPGGYVGRKGDCDDTLDNVHEGATEVCDVGAVDEDCDGKVNDLDPSVDLATATSWHTDGDGDGYGVAAVVAVSCAAPPGAVADATDCDDTRGTVYPWAGDTYNDGLDGDCDGLDCAAARSGSRYEAACPCEDCSWDVGNDDCKDAGYDGLASVPDAAADKRFEALNRKVFTSDSNAWIGLSRASSSDPLVWVDGTVFSYTNWSVSDGEPQSWGTHATKANSAGYFYRWSLRGSSGIPMLRVFDCSLSGL